MSEQQRTEKTKFTDEEVEKELKEAKEKNGDQDAVWKSQQKPKTDSLQKVLNTDSFDLKKG